jgi:hypothetical protein
MTITFQVIRKRFVFYMALFFAVHSSFSQAGYFQQEVNYKMDVTLNDEAHTISAFQQVKYINNSPQSLEYIYYHLWPNAYKNNNTALAKQLLKNGNTTFYFSKPNERGFIDSLNFKVNGNTVKWEYDPEHIDICKIILNEPLRSGDTITITTPFFVKIPDAKFSRLGHTEQAYYMTQWYPKPAVFDNKGWHPIPYLDQGEFYSEYGSFDVKITLPDNYVLAATGDRIDARDEEDFLNLKVNQTLEKIKMDIKTNDMSFPVSSKLLKTVRFRQYRVHDFAWFADKRFNVMQGHVKLPGNEREVTTWVFFTNSKFDLWSKAINYVNESVMFYSKKVGDYPYNHATAIDGTIMAGGGMEYPNITVIGDAGSDFDLDMVITHEVGHNWFYGILGSNERDNPAMDEGINSLYELRYVKEKYGDKKITAFINKDSTFKWFGLNKIPVWKYHEISFFSSLKSRRDQPISLRSEEFTEANYGSIVYSKTAVVFDYLMDYMGEENFDKAMKVYFENYKFRHPSPSDLIKTLSEQGNTNLEWFVRHLIISTDHIDYKIKKATRREDGAWEIKVKNKTGVNVPFNIYGFKNNKPVGFAWFDGASGTRTLIFPPAEVDHFKIDGNNRMPDINRKNNTIKTKGLFKKVEPVKLNFITAIENDPKTQINFTPILGYNVYNQFMLGISVYNYGLYPKRFEYAISPMYAFGTKTPVGFAECNLNIYPNNIFRQIVFGVKAKTFAYDYIPSTPSMNEEYLNYYKVAPYIKFEIKKKDPTSKISQFITVTNNNLFTDSLRYSFQANPNSITRSKVNTASMVNQINYDFSNKRSIDPLKLNLNLQQAAGMVKVSGTFNYQITTGRTQFVDLRIFAGTFISGSGGEKSYYAFRASGYNGWQDYLFESNYLGRNDRTSPAFNQFTEKDGNLKVWTPLGQSSRWLASFNIKSPRFFRIPIKAFADVVLCDRLALNKDKVLWDAGFNITLWQDVIEIYVPLIYNNDIRQTLELNNVNFAKQIRFTFNIHKLDPKTIIQTSLF